VSKHACSTSQALIPTLVDDRALLEGLQRFDERAQRNAFSRYAPRVFRLAFRMVGSMALAEDLTQEAMVRVFQRIGQFRGDAQLSTWIHSVAASVIKNGIRREQRWSAREVDLKEASAVATDQAGDAELARRLEREVNALPEDQRTVLIMFDVEGFTHDEIAAALGVTSNTSRQKLFRARARIRAQLGHLVGEGA
jgi:RNA polymerase sigma-70 factor (ECF subfamily)